MTIQSIEKVLSRAIAQVRKELADANINSMSLCIEAEGRTMEGDMKITFSLGRQYDAKTRGDTLEAVTTEFLRRNGWQRRHDSLRLTHDGNIESHVSDNDD